MEWYECIFFDAIKLTRSSEERRKKDEKSSGNIRKENAEQSGYSILYIDLQETVLLKAAFAYRSLPATPCFAFVNKSRALITFEA